MGLDTYASNTSEEIALTPEQARAFEETDIRLCGGIYSGSGSDGSFRGKVYGILVQEITGENLYQPWIPPETVQRMYRALAACDPEEAIDASHTRNVPADVVNLREFFRVCAEHGLGLIGWW